MSLVQHTLPNGDLQVSLINWADINALYGQIVLLDERNRCKCSVFSRFPYHKLREVIFLEPDTSIYPSKGQHTERPQVGEFTLKQRTMWIIALSRGAHLLEEECRRCHSSQSFSKPLKTCALCLLTYCEACPRIIYGAQKLVGTTRVKLPKPFRVVGATCHLCCQLCDNI